MIAEPYICIIGPTAGEIWWWNSDGQCVYEGCIDKKVDECWMPYADFEREKLKELRGKLVDVNFSGDYQLRLDRRGSTFYTSEFETLYRGYLADSESNRLLKRAEFLKAVCEKEGVEWLPQDRVVAHVQAHDIPFVRPPITSKIGPPGVSYGTDIVHELTKVAPSDEQGQNTPV